MIQKKGMEFLPCPHTNCLVGSEYDYDCCPSIRTVEQTGSSLHPETLFFNIFVTMRIDKWIWAVRLVKTRTLATEMCRLGRVYINEEAAKASRSLKIDDMVEVRFKRGRKKIYKVCGFSEKRVGAEVAKSLYEDHSPPPPTQSFGSVEHREKGAGRPTKKDRRQIDRLKG